MRLTRIDSAHDMARFHELQLQPTLFGEMSLVRRWVRIEGEGRALFETHPSAEAARVSAGEREKVADPAKKLAECR
jgi:predicted DNA-binding WGR domain protein